MPLADTLVIFLAASLARPLQPVLDDFAARARKWRGDGRDSYIFMINGSKVRAPAAAHSLQQRLGIEP